MLAFFCNTLLILYLVYYFKNNGLMILLFIGVDCFGWFNLAQAKSIQASTLQCAQPTKYPFSGTMCCFVLHCYSVYIHLAIWLVIKTENLVFVKLSGIMVIWWLLHRIGYFENFAGSIVEIIIWFSFSGCLYPYWSKFCLIVMFN